MKFNKIIALLLVVAVMTTLCACYNPDTVATSGETKITGGQYLAYQYFVAQKVISEKSAGSLAALLKTEIDGKTAAEYLNAETISAIKQDLYVKSECDRLDIKLDSLGEYQLEYYIQYNWQNGVSTTMQKNGIGYESYKHVATLSQMTSLLFDKYYGAGGQFEVKESELMAYYDQNFAKVSMYVFPVKDVNSLAITAATAALFNELALQMKDKVDAGASLASVVAEYYPTIQKNLGSTDKNLLTAEEAAAKLTSATLTPTDTSTYAEAVSKAAVALATGGCGVAVSETAVYIMVREQAYTDSTSFADLKATALSGLKNDEFSAYIKSEAEKNVELAVDSKAVKYYSINNIKGL